ncbi:TPA: hypothetical protein ACXIJH_005253 [Serratia marcescens]
MNGIDNNSSASASSLNSLKGQSDKLTEDGMKQNIEEQKQNLLMNAVKHNQKLLEKLFS